VAVDAPGVLCGVALPGVEGVYDLRLANGRIDAIEASRRETAGTIALPAFADLHVHADRAYARGPRPPSSLTDAIALVAEIRRAQREDDVRERASRLLARALGHGSLRIRSHVDVDPLVEERALRGVLAAREAFAGRIGLEIVAFATADLDPASAEGQRRLAAALEAGADLLGAVPAYNSDPRAAVDALLDLAARLGVPVDVHLDEHGDPARLLLEHVVDGTLARGLENRVTVSHTCALATVPDDVVRRTVAKVAAAGITVIVLPALNLYLQDRGAGTPRRRGVTLVQELFEAGVEIRFGSDNVADVFYPYGDADPLEAAFLAALSAQVDDEDVLLAGIAAGRTRLAPGDPADLLLVPARSFREALARRPAGRTVLRAGRVVSADA
jgi:cytosine deaminase